MASYFLDTSAIVKRYFPEQGHSWLLALCLPAHGNRLYISQAALVEVVATICRKAREQVVTVAERDLLIDIFRQDSQNNYTIIPVTTSVYTFAGNLCRSHSLRAYDAIQLACAISLRDEAAVSQAPLPIFVCADTNLITIASEEGLHAENPGTYQ
jgi:predicted nucleic acid-binding protein